MSSTDSSRAAQEICLPAAIETILTRASSPRLVEPGPTLEHLELLMRAAANAPDHGKLRPWRFIVVAGEARARFAELLASTLQQRDPAATPDMLQRERDKAMRAPTIIVAAAKVNPAAKIPAIEQVLAVAASVENVLLAAHSLGYGAMWKTGAPAYDDNFKRGLGLDSTDQILAFIYLGTPTGRTLPRDIRTDTIVRFF